MCKRLKLKFPMQAKELERILHAHCEQHGVWDDCIVEAEICEHAWAYSDVMSPPPIPTRKCIKCGKHEHFDCTLPWVDDTLTSVDEKGN